MEDEQKTILTIEHCGDKTTVELPWDAHVDDLVKAFYGAAVASTWNPKTMMWKLPVCAGCRENLTLFP